MKKREGNKMHIDYEIHRKKEEINRNEYIIAKYYIESETTLEDAAKAIALGQSIGPLSIRTRYENKELFEDYGAKIISNTNNTKQGIVEIAFPAHNINPQTDGITQLLCTLAGSLFDINILKNVKLLDFELPGYWADAFSGPRFGLKEIRKILGVHDRPLLGAIIKPKTGLPPELLSQLCYELAIGGCDFIKEDEILGNPTFCPMESRVPLIAKYLKKAESETGNKILYAPCLTVDVKYLRDHARKAVDLGASALHFNIYSGLSSYRMLSEDEQIRVPIHVQRGGDMAYTKNPFHGIDALVIFKAIRLCGGDITHVGMLGGYISTPFDKLQVYINALKGPYYNFKSTIPAISGGLHPGLVHLNVKLLGIDIMLMVGGAIMGHPEGITAGVRAMRQAIDAACAGIPIKEASKEHHELQTAIENWGIIDTL
ncbi:MAG: RuBisCO large subunit C-terminal-like domain-containing protein [Actinobacteria bacterium]|nr:RuBisCO large subunit C-terminal-like domain-containing protein [Actinomycetota bacterium]MCL5985189.1 RuBisCO large subunit C-terminal-like domain-containing protein [Actinomycetota bacterium]